MVGIVPKEHHHEKGAKFHLEWLGFVQKYIFDIPEIGLGDQKYFLRDQRTKSYIFFGKEDK